MYLGGSLYFTYACHLCVGLAEGTPKHSRVDAVTEQFKKDMIAASKPAARPKPKPKPKAAPKQMPITTFLRYQLSHSTVSMRVYCLSTLLSPSLMWPWVWEWVGLLCCMPR